MRSLLFSALTVLMIGPSGQGRGLLIPKDEKLPPLAMLKHRVKIELKDQVAITNISQTFRNHTSRQLEARYVFPVPAGASVNSFSMEVNGKEVKGEMLEAKQARSIYTSIVQRTQDPGLLEHLGKRLFQVRVFPIPPHGDQKLTLSFTSVAQREGDLVEFVYPLQTKGKAVETLEEFLIQASIHSSHGIQNVYSPSHALEMKRESDNSVSVTFEAHQAKLDRDFQLFYQLGEKDVGLTALTHRPIADDPGYFLMLITPRLELSQKQQVPRDVVFVVDTSGSMRGEKITQARKAVQYCLSHLGSQDRFSILSFASTVNPYAQKLTKAGKDQIEHAKKWVGNLNASGGTAIHEALEKAIEQRAEEKGRSFTIIFFTDGLPTIGQTNPKLILKDTLARNSANTRIFTFGVGNDVNAVLLDQLADQTRAVSSYVRPSEKIDTKVAKFYDKIRYPVLTNLKLSVADKLTLTEVYPNHLPDLFHGSQLTVLGRYRGEGASAVKLTGMVGEETKEFIYEMSFPKKSKEDKEFVEHLWARRKVGYLLDQIRANGEQKELKDEVIALAKRYGITTPYTSYLIVPDNPVTRAPGSAPGAPGTAAPPIPDVRFGRGRGGRGGGGGFGGGFAGGGSLPGRGGVGRGPASGGGRPSAPGFPGGPLPTTSKPAPVPPGGIPGVGGFPPSNPIGPVPGTERDPKAQSGEKRTGSKTGGSSGTKPLTVLGFAQKATGAPGGLEALRIAFANASARDETRKQLLAYQDAARQVAQGRGLASSGKEGVELSLANEKLRKQAQVATSTEKSIAGRKLFKLGVIWIDAKFTAKTPVMEIKAMSKAYFDILAHHPKIKDVYQLGNHLVWIAPNGTALVVDPTHGKEELKKEDIAKLFVLKK